LSDTGDRTASQSLQAMHRSSPEGYRRRACSPRNRGEMGPCGGSAHVSVRADT
jgi:hypothetical protein